MAASGPWDNCAEVAESPPALRVTIMITVLNKVFRPEQMKQLIFTSLLLLECSSKMKFNKKQIFPSGMFYWRITNCSMKIILQTKHVKLQNYPINYSVRNTS